VIEDSVETRTVHYVGTAFC